MMILLVLVPESVTAQDIPGLEVCTAEKQMARRTGCLQSNDQYLQQAVSKLARETDAKIPRQAAPSPPPNPKSLHSSQQSRS
jgi:hypothetical protein